MSDSAATAGSERGGVQGEVVAAMRDPGFYPHHPRTVEVRETHISWVFLAGDRVYKVRKEIVLPFLDYATPGRRRSMSHEEVRLNRRLAPDLYLGVRSIVRDAGALALVEDDRDGAVEYAVEMRRFREEQTLASRLDRGEVGAGDVSRVARRLADFHAAADGARGRGGPEDVRRIVGDTLSTLVGLADNVPAADLAAVTRFADAFVLGRRALLEWRAQGCVREGHGDLRAEHVVLEGDDVQVFDCVEFDPALREIDVAADLAFLVMDLEGSGRRDLARALVRAYRTAGGDPGDDDLIAFYAAWRACVRAMVAGLRARQCVDDPTGAERARADAAALCALARGFAWRGRGTRVLAVCGVAASGKTRLSRRIAGLWDVPHVRADVTRKRLAGLSPAQRGGDALYTDAANRRTYAELGRLASDALAAGGGVVVDATFRRAVDRDAFREGAGRDAAGMVFVECRAPAEVLLERARRRRTDESDASDATEEIVERQLSEFEPLDEVPGALHIALRTDRPLDEALADLEAMLDTRLEEGR